MKASKGPSGLVVGMMMLRRVVKASRGILDDHRKAERDYRYLTLALINAMNSFNAMSISSSTKKELGEDDQSREAHVILEPYQLGRTLFKGKMFHFCGFCASKSLSQRSPVKDDKYHMILSLIADSYMHFSAGRLHLQACQHSSQLLSASRLYASSKIPLLRVVVLPSSSTLVDGPPLALPRLQAEHCDTLGNPRHSIPSVISDPILVIEVSSAKYQ